MNCSVRYGCIVNIHEHGTMCYILSDPALQNLHVTCIIFLEALCPPCGAEVTSCVFCTLDYLPFLCETDKINYNTKLIWHLKQLLLFRSEKKILVSSLLFPLCLTENVLLYVIPFHSLKMYKVM